MRKEAFKCPHCGDTHREYVQWEGAPYPRCERCYRFVGKGLVPEELVQYRSSGKKGRGFLPKIKGRGFLSRRKKKRFSSMKKRKKLRSEKKGKNQVTEEGAERVFKGEEGEEPQKEEEGRRIRRKEEERASLFVVPRGSHEVLEEVLREFGCKELFINAMVRRSRRINGIHPGDLRNYISRMNSGIKSREQAAFIADEYRLALDEEKEKTPEGGYETAYPVEKRNGYERYKSPSRARKEDYYAEYPEERHVRYREPHRTRKERGEGVSRRDVREMLEGTLDRREQKREREETLRNFGDRIARVETNVANIPSRLHEGISEVLEKRKDTERAKGITKADINNAVNNAVLNVEKKYMEREFKKSTEESREREKEFQKTIEEVSKERNELLKELSARRRMDTSDYQTDSCKVIGEAVRGLKDVIETRHPVKIAIEGIPKLLYPEMGGLEKRRAPELKEDKTRTVGGGVWKYLDAEYVAEKED